MAKTAARQYRGEREFTWSFHVNYCHVMGLKSPRAVLEKAMKEGTVSQLGRGKYKMLKRRKAA